jgi:hypothetical protein
VRYRLGGHERREQEQPREIEAEEEQCGQQHGHRALHVGTADDGEYRDRQVEDHRRDVGAVPDSRAARQAVHRKQHGRADKRDDREGHPPEGRVARVDERDDAHQAG